MVSNGLITKMGVIFMLLNNVFAEGRFLLVIGVQAMPIVDLLFHHYQLDPKKM
jgi:hypothetical protein